jgi:pantothenate kinase
MDTILILDQDNRLKLRKVETIKKNGVDAWIKTGIEDGEKICITPLDIIAEGMKVRISKPETDSNRSTL